MAARIAPHLRVQKFAPVWSYVVHDAIPGAFQRQTACQQDHQHDVRKNCSEVHKFAHRLDAFDDADEREDPGDAQAQHQVPLRVSVVVPGRVADSENVFVEEFFSRHDAFDETRQHHSGIACGV